MSTNPMRQLECAIVKGKIDKIACWTEKCLKAGYQPKTIVDGAVVKAMKEVGDKWKVYEYFIPNVLVSAMAIKLCLSTLKPLLQQSGEQSLGKAVAGTVDLSKGDPAIEYTKLLDSDKAVLPDVSRLIRTLSVLQVAVDAGKPTVRRTSSFFRRAIVNAVADREELLRQGLTAMGKGFTLSIFGSAYLKDGGRHLQTCKDQAGATCPSTDNWKYWSRIIEFSCNQIATATGATHQCLGDWSTTPPH